MIAHAGHLGVNAAVAAADDADPDAVVGADAAPGRPRVDDARRHDRNGAGRDDRPLLEQSLSRTVAGRSEEVEFRVVGADGTERRVVSSVTPITNEVGEVVGAVGFVRDVKSSEPDASAR